MMIMILMMILAKSEEDWMSGSHCFTLLGRKHTWTFKCIDHCHFYLLTLPQNVLPNEPIDFDQPLALSFLLVNFLMTARGFSRRKYLVCLSEGFIIIMADYTIPLVSEHCPSNVR